MIWTEEEARNVSLNKQTLYIHVSTDEAGDVSVGADPEQGVHSTQFGTESFARSSVNNVSKKEVE